jgi:hypothetical protein
MPAFAGGETIRHLINDLGLILNRFHRRIVSEYCASHRSFSITSRTSIWTLSSVISLIA